MIEVNKLTVRYGNKFAIKDLNIQIPRNQITAIVGPSGCGKTTFLQAINRMTDLIPDVQVSGSIRVDDTNIESSSRTATELRKSVGMIFQKPNPFPMSIQKNIHLALKEHGIKDKKRRAEISEKVLMDVGLWDEVKDRLSDSALRLSGGQQQRLCIARAIALEPDILLMDEPCSALDPIASATVESLIVRLKDKFTIVIVTHNLAQAHRISDRLAIFWVKDGAGQIIEQGPTKLLFESPVEAISKAYLSGSQG